MDPITDWSQLPLVCGITDTARVLNTSASSINRALKLGTMQPQPMPRLAGGKWQWSKAVLKAYVDGGYRQMPVRNRRKVNSGPL